ncbi:MAG: hypothetical protein C0506_09255 [Anaerolinea sp.]|nr:hypothetical protein [Anaerolinea sp.]
MLRGFAAFLLLAGLVLGAQFTLFSADHAHATLVTTIDADGANDEPGQKDLTQMSVDNAGAPTSFAITWNWDETVLTGANTADACALFDSDGDGNVNFSLCQEWEQNVAQPTTVLYSCSDKKPDRCTAPNQAVASPSSACSATIDLSGDPFDATFPGGPGDDYPADSKTLCTAVLADVGGPATEFLNVCSYPSGQSGSDPSDCILPSVPTTALLTIIKEVVNGNGGTAASSDFTIAVTGTNATPSSFPGSSTGTAVTMDAGTFSITESGPSGYSGSISGTGCPTTFGASAAVSIAAGATVTCTITNDDIAPKLTVTKVVTNNNGGTAVVADFPLFVDATAVTSGVQNTFNAGAHTVSETGMSGYAATISGDCAANGSITLAPGDVKACTITNDDISPRLKLVKTVVNDNGGTATASNFQGKIDGGNVAWGVFVDVAPGSHTASETVVANYTAGTWGGDCAANGTVSVALGQSKTCTITNNDNPARLIVQKTVVGGNAQVFDFSRTGIANFTLANGQENNSGFTLNAGSYTICELNLAVAWSTTATVSINGGAAAPLTLTNPNLPADLGNRCGTVTLNVGDSVTVVFTNTPPPGGDARTIGYWKNWSSCSQSNGKQYDKAVARGDWNKTLDGNLPQTIGTALIDTCEEAVSLLNKTPISGTKKAANDPAFNLAAQLLAAKLNVTAGAGTCAAATAAIAQAQAELVAISFDGITHTNISKPLATTLNNLAAILDSYNNNTLC